MSEAGGIKEIAPKFLRIANEIAIEEPSDIVRLDQVAEHMSPDDLHTDGSDYVEKLATVAQYLGSRGFLERQSSGWGMFSMTREGINEAEGNNRPREPSVSNVFNISGDNYGGVIGTHNTNELTNNFDFRTVEQRIESEGGEDKEELREALEEIRRLLESGDSMKRGFLSRFSGALEKHSWFTGAVAQALVGFGTQAVG